MSKQNDGGPAFPVEDLSKTQCSGMSLRDVFAMSAPDMPQQWWEDSQGDGQHWAQADAAWRYFHADAALAAREQESSLVPALEAVYVYSSKYSTEGGNDAAWEMVGSIQKTCERVFRELGIETREVLYGDPESTQGQEEG